MIYSKSHLLKPREEILKKILELHSVSKKYQKSNEFANDNISVSFIPGEVVAITGHNGAGKSTLLNQIIGITRPTTGAITFNNYSFTTDGASARKFVSMMPQFHAPLRGVTMKQSIESILRIRGLSNDVVGQTNLILKELNISDWKDTPGEKLSGGLQRLTSFAMTVAAPPPIILLDEPTNDVDPVRRKIMWLHLKKLAKSGHIVIVVTHNLFEVEHFSDRYILLDKGKLIDDKKIGDLQDDKYSSHILSVYIDQSEIIDPKTFPESINYKFSSEDNLYEFEMNSEQILNGFKWVTSMIKNKKVINYNISTKSISNTYEELTDGK